MVTSAMSDSSAPLPGGKSRDTMTTRWHLHPRFQEIAPGLDEPYFPIDSHESVLKLLPVTGADHFMKRPPDLLPVFGMDIHEGSSSLQLFRLFQQIPVRRAIVEPAPFEIDDRDEVADIVEDG